MNLVIFFYIYCYNIYDKKSVFFLNDAFIVIYQDTHNQAGIAHSGGIVPLLKLLDSRNGTLQHNAAFALYGLADNEVKP